MWHKYGWIGYVLLSVVIIASLVRCGLFGVAVRNVATDCGPELISEVAGILARDTWETDLAAKARTLGTAAVACAVRSVLKSVTEGSTATMGSHVLNLPTHSDQRQEIRIRADSWLKRQKGR